MEGRTGSQSLLNDMSRQTIHVHALIYKPRASRTMTSCSHAGRTGVEGTRSGIVKSEQGVRNVVYVDKGEEGIVFCFVGLAPTHPHPWALNSYSCLTLTFPGTLSLQPSKDIRLRNSRLSCLCRLPHRQEVMRHLARVAATHCQ
jgi:hypothetical protein